MFGYLLLETRLAVGGVLAAALAEAVVVALVSRRVPWIIPRGDRYLFLRQRLALAVVFALGVLVYSRLKDLYLYDPFFHALYTFLVAFFLFYYLTGLAAAAAVLLAGPEARREPTAVGFLAAALILLAVFAAKPQVSVFGFLCGAGAHLMGRLGGAGGGFRRFMLAVAVALLLFLVLSLLVR